MWVELDMGLLRSAMSGPERAALDRAATDTDQQAALPEIAENIAAEWRCGLRSVCTVDARPLYIPSELLIHILADFRYRAATRLPGMKGLIDDLRVDEWRRANTIRDNLRNMTFVLPEEDFREESEQSGGGAELASGEGPYPTGEQMDGLL